MIDKIISALQYATIERKLAMQGAGHREPLIIRIMIDGVFRGSGVPVTSFPATAGRVLDGRMRELISFSEKRGS